MSRRNLREPRSKCLTRSTACFTLSCATTLRRCRRSLWQLLTYQHPRRKSRQLLRPGLRYRLHPRFPRRRLLHWPIRRLRRQPRRRRRQLRRRKRRSNHPLRLGRLNPLLLLRRLVLQPVRQPLRLLLRAPRQKRLRHQPRLLTCPQKHLLHHRSLQPIHLPARPQKRQPRQLRLRPRPPVLRLRCQPSRSIRPPHRADKRNRTRQPIRGHRNKFRGFEVAQCL
jgi:hypothetical protein